jgi:hypothetical protein
VKPIIPRCTWRTCRLPAVWDITAGTPGSGGYASTFSCAAHSSDVEARTSRLAGNRPAVTERLPDQPTPTEDQEQLAIDL